MVDTATTAWVNAVVAAGGTVSAARQRLVDKLIVGLKADGIWTKLDRLWLHAAENNASATIDLGVHTQATLFNLSVVSNKGFDLSYDFSRIEYNYNASIHGSAFTQNSAHLGVWNETDGAANEVMVLAAGAGTTLHIYPKYSDNNLYTRINEDGSAGAAISNCRGLLVGNRSAASGSGAEQGYQNGVSLGSNTSTSSAPFNGGLRTYGARRISAVCVGGSLNSTEQLALYTRLRYYMVGVGVVFDAAILAQIWADEVVAAGGTVSGGRQTLVTNLIQGLIDDGIWAKLDRLWLFAAENTQSALVDLVNQSAATATGGPTFTPDVGYEGNSSPAYIETNYNLSVNAVNYTVNSAHISVWGLTAGGFSNAMVGSSVNGGTYCGIYCQYTGDGLAYLRVNDNPGSGGFSADPQGFFLGNRSAPTAREAYRNGTSLGTYGAIGNIGGLLNETMRIWVGKYAATSYGGSLTATEAANFYTRLDTYMAALTGPAPATGTAALIDVKDVVAATGTVTTADVTGTSALTDLKDVVSGAGTVAWAGVAKTFYVLGTAATSPNWWGVLQDGGSAPTAANSTFGWKVGTTNVASWRARLGASTQAATSQAGSYIDALTAPTKGTGATNTTSGDSFITPTTYRGTFFPSGNWTFNWNLRTSNATCTGRIRMQVFASVNADGTSAREITTTTLVGATVTMNGTTTDFNSSISWAAPEIDLVDEYLFFQLEWNETTVGNQVNAGPMFRLGTAAITTSNFLADAFGPAALTDLKDVVAATGTVSLLDVTGTSALNDLKDVAAATGGVLVEGPAALTDKPDTVASSGGTVAWNTAIALNDQKDTVASSGGIVEWRGTAAFSDQKDLVSATGTVGFGYDPATDAWIAAVLASTGIGAGTVSTARRNIVDILIRGLKTDGLFAKLDRLWIFAAENRKSALVDMIATQLATEVPTSINFTVDWGYLGLNGHLNTNYTPSTAGGNYTANSASFGFWSLSSGAVSDTRPAVASLASPGAILYLRNTFGNLNYNIQGSFAEDVVNSDAAGFWVVNRDSSTLTKVYLNGSVFYGTGSATAGANPNQQFAVLGDTSGSNNWPGESAACCFGSKLTATEQANLYTRLNDYMGMVGLVTPTPVSGTAVFSDKKDVVAVAGSVEWQGTAALLESKDTVAATGTVAVATVDGVAALLETADTVAATGTAVTEGTAALQDIADTVSATGTVAFVPVTGTGNLLETADTVAASVTVFIVVTGTAALQETADTVAAVGNIINNGIGALLEGADTVAAAGTVTAAGVVVGAGTLIEDRDTVSATGAVTGEVIGIPPGGGAGAGAGGGRGAHPLYRRILLRRKRRKQRELEEASPPTLPIEREPVPFVPQPSLLQGLVKPPDPVQQLLQNAIILAVEAEQDDEDAIAVLLEVL